MVLLRDGRTLIGYLRSVDQFANLVLHRTIERIHVGKEYGDIPRGVFIVRGENVALLGEIVRSNLFFCLYFKLDTNNCNNLFSGQGKGKGPSIVRGLGGRYPRRPEERAGTQARQEATDEQGTQGAWLGFPRSGQRQYVLMWREL